MNDYLFIRIPKTASTSICHVLRPIEHKRAVEWKEQLGSEWDNKLTFSVVRDPYDRFISMYYFFSVFGKAQKDNGTIKKQDVNDWLEQHEISETEGLPDYEFIKPQADYLHDEKGNLMVKRLIKFENLSEEWPALLQEIGREFEPLPVKRKGWLRPDNVVLTDLSKQKIHDYYQRDFELLGYKQ